MSRSLNRRVALIAGASALGMLAMAADATRDGCLREAGIERAAGLIAAVWTSPQIRVSGGREGSSRTLASTLSGPAKAE
jgi:hypothetical protein